MLYRPIHSNKKEDITRIDESNFISSDMLGIFDSDARVKLSALTIEKLFEGLDIDNTNEMHDFITSFAPSLSKVMGVHSSESNYAFDILKAQLMYMQTILQDVENDIDYFYKIELDNSILSCTCIGFGYRGKCKHIEAVKNIL